MWAPVAGLWTLPPCSARQQPVPCPGRPSRSSIVGAARAGRRINIFQPDCEELARQGREAAGVGYSSAGPLASWRFMTLFYEPRKESAAALHRA